MTSNQTWTLLHSTADADGGSALFRGGLAMGILLGEKLPSERAVRQLA